MMLIVMLHIPLNGVHLPSGQDTILLSVFEGFQVESLPHSESMFMWEKLTTVLPTTSSRVDFPNFRVRGLSDEL
jgi:hypothetical protein